MEPEDSLPFLQEPTISSYREADDPVHTIRNYFSKINFNIILPPTSSFS
jgi:hypothetical protein